MARVLLIMPHLPQRMGAPYLGQQYIASSLLADGHNVQVLDPAAVLWTGSDDDVIDFAEHCAPDMIGMTLFTYNAKRGYTLATRLRGVARLLVAGGPHPTACPSEPLEFGFDVSVSGEGEQTVLGLARYLDGQQDLASIGGTRYQDGEASPAEPLQNLDSLAFPLKSYPCYDTSWYSQTGLVVPGGMMTSRGCPARCTFCANYVTGRAHRWRSPENVIAEMVALRGCFESHRATAGLAASLLSINRIMAA